MLGNFNKWNIIQFSHKATSFEDIEKTHKVVLDCIGYNMAALVQTGKYGDINKRYTTKMVYHVIKLMLEA